MVKGVKRKTDALSKDDRALLTQAVIDVNDGPPNALHIFATNKEVNEHNSATLAALYPDYVNIQAEDYRKDPITGNDPGRMHPRPKKRST